MPVGTPGPVVGCSVSNNGSYPEKDWSGYLYTKKSMIMPLLTAQDSILKTLTDTRPLIMPK